MSAAERFRELNAILADHLAGHGFRRAGQWFTRASKQDRGFVAIQLRKLPQPGSKRIVFQVVTYAGYGPHETAVRITSREAASTLATFEHHLLEGAVERFWTLWPSSDAAALANQLHERLRGEAIVAADAHLADHTPED